MSSAAAHPRRRPARDNDSAMTPSLIDCFQNMSLRKGDTFHPSTSNDDQLWDPLESKPQSPSMPARSTTCPKSLEDLLIGAGERRAADLLARVDKAIATNSKLALGQVLSEPEVLPVPTFNVDTSNVIDEKTATRLRHRNSHSSDSGLGSSIAESTDSVTAPSVETDTDSTVTAHSLSSISSVDEERGLSKYAAEQVHKHVIKPILREQALKEFHPLIKDVPRRIGNRDIKNLRDLEKILIFCAPDYSRSPYKYLQFCERTIRVLHTTVTTLHESDQRAPADRPYTQGYFFDLVEQIRRYATILAATREKQAKGEKLDEMDYTEGESVSVLGGMTQNGKPAELVRHKDGKTISIATGEVVSADDLASSTMKRPMSNDITDLEDDDVLRSMARRKKNAKPEIHECPLCDKEFKRPCDLTKHVKTHERPWKCPDDKCKYHEHGWPTEKERDRHVNDKHSSAPSLYHCLFKPCPYTSKRESNCKQHMEKAHGWEYVRSKSNGKGKAISVTRLPRGSIPPSPASSLMTPLTPIAPSPSTKSWSTSSRHDSMPPPGVAGPSNFGTPVFPNMSPDFASHFNMNFDFNNMDAFPTSALPITPAMSDDRRGSSVTSSSHSGLNLDGSSFDDAISPEDLNFGGYNFGDFRFQQATPDSSAGPSSGSMSNNLHAHPGFDSGSHLQHTSPGAQLDQTFTSGSFYDAMNLDEGYGPDYGSGPNEDFTLFGSSNAPAPNNGGEMFPSLNESSWGNFGKQFDNSQQPPQLSTGNSALDELFPELKQHRQ